MKKENNNKSGKLARHKANKRKAAEARANNPNKKLGLKELVKSGDLTAKSALTRLLAKADLSGEFSLAQRSKTANWLQKKIV